MNLSGVFIKRPIATSLIMMGLALAGLQAYRSLAVAELPDVEYPSLNVNVALPGSDPTTMATAVASPLERQFTTIAGVDAMTSSSSTGATQITLQFDLGRNIDKAAVDVQTAIAAALPLLPPAMPSPPSFRRTNPADDPILYLALTSPSLSMSALDEYAETLLAPRLSMLNGVAQVDVNGAQKYAVRIQVDPDRLRARSLDINDVERAVQNWNVSVPTGQIYGRTATYSIAANGQLPNAEAFGRIVVAYRNGAPIRLDQVATVVDSVENNRLFSWLYTKRGVQSAITLGVRRQMTSNVIEVAEAVKALIPSFLQELPPSVHLTIRTDRSGPIRDAFRDIQATMAVTGALVVVVIFLFLRSGTATVIPVLAVPLSILGTFIMMAVAGFTLNNLSMMALILSIGFVVDDAIVMLENIVRHVERGETPYEAALAGSSEIVFTIVSITISLAAAFIPILFLDGVLGRVFREFAVTITAAILISGLVSITLTPMLCSRFLKPRLATEEPASWTARVWTSATRAYETSLRATLRHRVAMTILFVVVAAATAGLFMFVPKGFVPDQDNNLITVNLRAPQGASYQEMSTYAQRAAEIVNRDPDVDGFTLAGGSASGTAATLRFLVDLVPRRNRTRTAAAIAQQLRGPLARVAGVRAALSLPPAIQIGGRLGSSNYTVVVQSENSDRLYTSADRLEQQMERLPELQDVSNDMELKSPLIQLVIDRDKAAATGLDPRQIENSLYSGFGQKWSSTIYGSVAQYRVLLELDPRYQQFPDSLNGLAFRSSGGQLVPLESVAGFKQTIGPQSINHSGQLPAVAISFGLRPGASLGAAIDRIKELQTQALPADVAVKFEGTAKAFQSSMNNLGTLLILTIGLVYIVLGMLYESYVHPITILAGLPAAGLGALAALWICGSELNVYSYVGLIMLVGIVKKNAILQIDFALDAERLHGRTPYDAIVDGCIARFRPIMMTTMAALFGGLPIALGLGAGGEARRPLGLAVVGGLLVSQLVTLYLTPIVYIWLATWVKTRRIQVNA